MAEYDLLDFLSIAETRSPELVFARDLFDLQRNLFFDASKQIAVCCGRRGGKSVALGAIIEKHCLLKVEVTTEDYPKIAYGAPTKDHATRLLWPKLPGLFKKYGIVARFDNSRHIAKLWNGIEVWVFGLDSEYDMGRLRGFPYLAIIVDEAQSVRSDFENFVEDIAGPALIDYDGQVILCGSPNASCMGYFHDAHVGLLKNWSSHSWEMADNPYFPRWRGKPDWREQAAAIYKAEREKRGWDENDPTFLREYRGRWIRDESCLVYKYNPKVNDYKDLPRGSWQYVFGIDFGFVDAFAIVVWAFCSNLPDVYEVETYSVRGLYAHQWANAIMERIDKYHPISIVGDCSGGGKQLMTELNARFGTYLKNAEKTSKISYIELMNSDFVSGKIHIREDSSLKYNLQMLQWHKDRHIEDPLMANDDCDAALYGWRESLHWAARPDEVIPRPGDPGYGDYQIEQLEKEAKQQINAKRGRW